MPLQPLDDNTLANFREFHKIANIEPEGDPKKITLDRQNLEKAYVLATRATGGVDINNKEHQRYLNLAYHSCTHKDLQAFDATDATDFCLMLTQAGTNSNEAKEKISGIIKGLRAASSLGSTSQHSAIYKPSIVVSCVLDYFAPNFEERFTGISAEQLKLFNQQLFTNDFTSKLYRNPKIQFNADGQNYLIFSAINQQAETQMQQVKTLLDQQETVKNQELLNQKIDALRNTFSFAASVAEVIFKDSASAQKIVTIGNAALTITSACVQIFTGAATGLAMGSPIMAAGTGLLSLISIFTSQSKPSGFEQGLRSISQQLCAMQKTMLNGFQNIERQLANNHRETMQHFDKLQQQVTQGFGELENFLTGKLKNLELSQKQIQLSLDTLHQHLNSLTQDVREVYVQQIQFNAHVLRKIDDSSYTIMNALGQMRASTIKDELDSIEDKLISPKTSLGDEKNDPELFNKLYRMLTNKASDSGITGANNNSDDLDSVLRDQANLQLNVRVNNAVQHIGFIFNALQMPGKPSNYLIWTQSVNLLLFLVYLSDASFCADLRRTCTPFQQRLNEILQNAKNQQNGLIELIKKIPTLARQYINNIENLCSQLQAEVTECKQIAIRKSRETEVEQNNKKLLAIYGNDFAQTPELLVLQKQTLESKHQMDMKPAERAKWLAEMHTKQNSIARHREKINSLEEENERQKIKTKIVRKTTNMVIKNQPEKEEKNEKMK